LSWLSSASKVAILDHERLCINRRDISVYTFTSEASPTPSYLLEFSKNEQERSISYCSFEDRQAMLKAVNADSLKPKVQAIFSLHDETSKLDSSKKRSVVYIDITDEEGFFKCGVKNIGMKLSQKRDAGSPNVMHYPYKEPLSLRNKESP
jgi:hypothetical protein